MPRGEMKNGCRKMNSGYKKMGAERSSITSYRKLLIESCSRHRQKRNGSAQRDQRRHESHTRFILQLR